MALTSTYFLMIAVIPLGVFQFVILLELIALYLCVSVLVECYRENQKRKRQNYQCQSKPNNPSGRNFTIFSNPNIQRSPSQSLWRRIWDKRNVMKKLLNCSRRSMK